MAESLLLRSEPSLGSTEWPHPVPGSGPWGHGPPHDLAPPRSPEACREGVARNGIENGSSVIRGAVPRHLSAPLERGFRESRRVGSTSSEPQPRERRRARRRRSPPGSPASRRWSGPGHEGRFRSSGRRSLPRPSPCRQRRHREPRRFPRRAWQQFPAESTYVPPTFGRASLAGTFPGLASLAHG
ncbi:MAG: hypothetical protein AMS18_07085 [Gemmatimonas sp. SG8_17]|nr:MAG: hypothetical protein AMS18_07085 [Gemmatimonas sp. SG8_17]